MTDSASRKAALKMEAAEMVKAIFAELVKRAAKQKTAGRGATSFVAGMVATKLATRSVPGALLVGGGLLVKHLYDRKRARDPEVESVRDKLAQHPELAADIARTQPELLTDAADDKDRAAAIEARLGEKPEVIPGG